MRAPLQDPGHDRRDVTTPERKPDPAIALFLELLCPMPYAATGVRRALLAELDDHALGRTLSDVNTRDVVDVIVDLERWRQHE
jgi:hypothetical protein